MGNSVQKFNERKPKNNKFNSLGGRNSTKKRRKVNPSFSSLNRSSLRKSKTFQAFRRFDDDLKKIEQKINDFGELRESEVYNDIQSDINHLRNEVTELLKKKRNDKTRAKCDSYFKIINGLLNQLENKADENFQLILIDGDGESDFDHDEVTPKKSSPSNKETLIQFKRNLLKKSEEKSVLRDVENDLYKLTKGIMNYKSYRKDEHDNYSVKLLDVKERVQKILEEDVESVKIRCRTDLKVVNELSCHLDEIKANRTSRVSIQVINGFLNTYNKERDLLNRNDDSIKNRDHDMIVIDLIDRGRRGTKTQKDERQEENLAEKVEYMTFSHKDSSGKAVLTKYEPGNKPDKKEENEEEEEEEVEYGSFLATTNNTNVLVISKKSELDRSKLAVKQVVNQLDSIEADVIRISSSSANGRGAARSQLDAHKRAVLNYQELDYPEIKMRCEYVINKIDDASMNLSKARN